MSIPIRFKFYTWDGQLLAHRSILTMSYTQNTGDLNAIGKRLQEANMADHQRFIHPQVKYAVPDTSPDYMFDLEDPLAILPNRFKDKE